MFKGLFILALLIFASLSVPGKAIAEYKMDHATFAHLTSSQKRAVVKDFLKTMVDIESRYKFEIQKKNPNKEKLKKYTQFLKRMGELLMSSAHAVDTPFYRSQLQGFQTLLSNPNKCIYGGWISQMRGNVCTHPRNTGNSPEARTYRAESGCPGTQQISCNPAIFGYRIQTQRSLFCVPAVTSNDDPANAAIRCMEKTLSAEGDGSARRLEHLAAQLSQDRELANNLFTFLMQICVCQSGLEGFNDSYRQRIRPHRTCYGMMNTISRVTASCDEPATEGDGATTTNRLFDNGNQLTILRQLQQQLTHQSSDLSTYDGFYQNVLSGIENSAEFRGFCPATPSQGGDADSPNGNGTQDTDGDGTPDSTDTDDDNDGIPDSTDPDDRVPDSDNDGTPNATDTDDDNDRTPDATDTDDDNDGVPDATDPQPNNSDVPNGPDTDNDGVPDSRDPAPNDPNVPADPNGTGGAGVDGRLPDPGTLIAEDAPADPGPLDPARQDPAADQPRQDGPAGPADQTGDRDPAEETFSHTVTVALGDAEDGKRLATATIAGPQPHTDIVIHWSFKLTGTETPPAPIDPAATAATSASIATTEATVATAEASTAGAERNLPQTALNGKNPIKVTVTTYRYEVCAVLKRGETTISAPDCKQVLPTPTEETEVSVDDGPTRPSIVIVKVRETSNGVSLRADVTPGTHQESEFTIIWYEAGGTPSTTPVSPRVDVTTGDTPATGTQPTPTTVEFADAERRRIPGSSGKKRIDPERKTEDYEVCAALYLGEVYQAQDCETVPKKERSSGNGIQGPVFNPGMFPPQPSVPSLGNGVFRGVL